MTRRLRTPSPPLRTSPRRTTSPPLTTSPRLTTSQWLRTHTRDEHAAAEAGLDLGRLRAPADLAGWLRAWAGVWQEIRRAAGGPDAAALAGPELLTPATQSLAWLATDLADLDGGTSPDLLDDPPDPPDPPAAMLLTEPAGVWGAAYVLRGSRLGGQFLAPAVAAALGLAAGRGTAFLASAGADTGAEWVAFRRRLDGAALTADELAAAGAAASWTFGWVGAALAAALSVGT